MIDKILGAILGFGAASMFSKDKYAKGGSTYMDGGEIPFDISGEVYVTFKDGSEETIDASGDRRFASSEEEAEERWMNTLLEDEDIEEVDGSVTATKVSTYAKGGMMAELIEHINSKYDGVVASKTYSDNRIQVVSRFFNTLSEIKRKEFEGSGLIERYGSTSSYVLYSNKSYFAKGGSTYQGGGTVKRVENDDEHGADAFLVGYEPYFEKDVNIARIDDKSKTVKPTHGYFPKHPLSKKAMAWAKKNGYKYIFEDGGSTYQGG